MQHHDITGILEFLRSAERLKNVSRTSWTSEGKRESVAEHTWRLCLIALVLGREFDGVDMAKLMKMCIVHDLGEAIGGDISATLQPPGGKAAQERVDLLTLLEPLPEPARTEIVDLWDEYETATTPEARVAKALDKLETIMQHNQGRNPEGFNYAFNLEYGAKFTADHPVIAEIRRTLDTETSSLAASSEQDSRDRKGRTL
jgi:putative hydrolases of HD superfamily